MNDTKIFLSVLFRISMLSELAKLSQKIEILSLIGNPVTRRQHYRLYVVSKIPSLLVLDFVKIGAKERYVHVDMFIIFLFCSLSITKLTLLKRKCEKIV